MAFFKYGVVACVWLLAITMPVLLVRKNLPHLKSIKAASHLFEAYSDQVAQSLPSQGAVVLGDDPFRLAYLQAVLTKNGGHSPLLLLDTGKLGKDAQYTKFVERFNPGYQLTGPWTNLPASVAPAWTMVRILEHLEQNHPIYYMHPSFGYYFEMFYAEPHGLVYRLKPYPAGEWDAPPLSKQLMAENRTFWQKTSDEVLPAVFDYQNKIQQTPAGLWETVLNKLHLKDEPESIGQSVASYYARGLDEWGVELQVAGARAEAGKCFDQTLQLNPHAISAHVNQLFNQSLASGKKLSVQPSTDIAKIMEQYPGGWSGLLRSEGPIDEPNFRSELGVEFKNGFNYRQAMQEFDRVRILVPGDLETTIHIAQTLIEIQTYTNGLSLLLPYKDCYSMALTNIDAVLKSYPTQPNALFLKSYALMQLKSYARAIDPLSRIVEQADQTNTYNIARLNRAIAYYKIGNYNAARSDYEAVSRSLPKAYQAYYGLAEIAYHEKDKPSAIKNYQLYLNNAPSGTEEAKSANARLKELQTSAP